MDRRWNLPSNVEEDGESRVPTLGLHQYGIDMDQDDVDGYKPSDDRLDSGLCDSGVGVESFRSGDSLTESFQRFSLGSSTNTPNSQLPGTKLDSQTDNLDLTDPTVCVSVDEAYKSGEGLSLSSLISSSEDNTQSLNSQTQCSDRDSGIIQDNTILYEKQRQEEVYRIYSQDEDGDTQLHLAIIQKMQAMALQMIAMTTDPDFLSIVNNLCQTPLHLATITKQPSVIRRLLTRGAALDVRDRHGNTALHLACREGDLDCVKALTAPLTTSELKGAPYSLTLQQIPQDTEIMNYDGETCLHLAAANQHTGVISYLVSQYVRADINTRDGRSGRTVLHHAVEAGRDNLVQFILRDCNAEVNLGTFDNTTALQLAVGLGYVAIETLLIQHGADSYEAHQEETLSDSEDEMMDSVEFDDIQIAGQPISTR